LAPAAGSGTIARVGDRANPLRAVPSVERLTRLPEALELVARYRRERVVETVRLVLADGVCEHGSGESEEVV
jgi:hypothetical protein